MKHMVRHLVCLAAVAGLAFSAMAYDDEFVECSDESLATLSVLGNTVYAFTNAAAGEVTLRFKKDVTVLQSLVVGGGGGGGTVIGGGGGAGAVLTAAEPFIIPADTTFRVLCGAGGTGTGGTGTNGGKSMLVSDLISFVAFGGGGGGGFFNQVIPGAAAVPNEIASGGGSANGKSVGTVGIQWNTDPAQGYPGAVGGGNLGGGGGGSRGPASGGTGGAGFVSSITGVEKTYGAGGKGGARAEGTGADAEANTGCGGNGGGYSGGNHSGGKGGSGLVAIAFQSGDRINYRFEVLPTADRYCEIVPIKPDVVVSNPVSHAVLTRGTDYELEFINNRLAGTATVLAIGKEGTSYEGFRAGTSFTILPWTFSIAPIASRLYFGEAIEPTPVVTCEIDGAALTEGVDFTVAYSDNDKAGTATVTATGVAGTRYEGLVATRTFSILAVPSDDEFAWCSDEALRPVSVLGNTVYTFTNAAVEEVIVQFKKDVTVLQSLVVGGGGGGGATIGGGGGAGAVLVSTEPVVIPANTPVFIYLGAGGAGGPPGSGVCGTGGNGGKSMLVSDAVSLVAYGGGGGGGWWNQDIPGAAAVPNEIASGGGSANGKSVGTAGVQWNTDPALGYSGARGNNDLGGGGGGSRGAASGGTGGAGLVSSFTGVERTYGAGGKGGARADGNGADAPANTGSGGNGGGYANGDRPGGKGGSGLIAIAFQPGDRVNYRFELLPIADRYYTTEPIVPEVIVSNPVSHAVLVRGTDYELEFADNTAVGTATVMAVGKAGTMYEGFRAGTSFAILPWTFTIAPIASQLYCGEAIEPTLVVTRDRDGVTLTAGEDFTIGYSDNDKVGTATVTVTGKDGTIYAGLTATQTFTILAPAFSIAAIPDQLYSGEAFTPTVTVTRDFDGAAMTAGVDYDVGYSENVRVGTATVTVTGKDGTIYAGHSATRTFKILPPAFSIAAIPDQLYSGEAFTPTVTVTRDFDGAAMTAGVDYDVGYSDNDKAGTATVTATGKAGTLYEGLTATRTFNILPPTFSIAAIPDQMFLGAAVAPAVAVSRDFDGEALTAGEDFTVGYSDNDKVGTATVTVTGKEGTLYEGCSATQTFRIAETWYDDYVTTDDMSVRATNVNGRLVYIFTNVAKVAQFIFRQSMTLKDALLVGGGGAGGCVIGGGGGGGGVVTLAVERVFFEGARLDITVGDGGVPNTTWAKLGGGGGASTVTVNSNPYLEAFGGAGGGGYTSTEFVPGQWGSSGGVGSMGGNVQILEGYHWTKGQGNPGAPYVSKDNLGGGGGGAFKAGAASNGGEGLTNAITGVEEVYGSGGGGGSRSGTYADNAGQGGTHAGNGGERAGFPGDDGFGGGGGAGSFGGGIYSPGGRGGSGTVILAFEVGGEVGQPEIESATIDFPYGTTQPHATVVLGGESAKSYAATVKMQFGTDGETWLQTTEVSDVFNGESAEAVGFFSPASGSDVYLKVVVSAEGAETRERTVHMRATNPQSPNFGKGGGAGIIHVRPGATGRNDGTDWFNAYTSFREAVKQLSVERGELWLSGDDVVEISAPETIAPSVPAVLCGGFSGVETSIVERAVGSRSTVTVNGSYTALGIVNANALTLDGFRTRNGSCGLSQSGAGALTVTNCVFEKVSATGVSVRGSGLVRFVDVRFSEFYNGTQGAALFLNGPSRAILDDCLFVSNGVPFSSGLHNTSYTMRGAAFYALDTPVTVRNCRFVGNRGQALDFGTDFSGGIVRLNGNSGGSVFSNCCFVANESTHGFQNYTQYPTEKGAGTLTLDLGSAARTVDIVNCTFAYNILEGCVATAGLNVRGGTANVRNSIFFGQKCNPENEFGRDILVSGAASKVNVDYTLFAEVSTNTCSTTDGGELKFGEGIATGDPLFVAAADELDGFVITSGLCLFDLARQNQLVEWANVHLRGGSGYVDEKLGPVNAYRRFARSPALNTGDPADRRWKLEPKPNGKRVNLGAYGGTPWATMSKGGGALILR